MLREDYNKIIKSFDITSSISSEFLVNNKLEKVYYWNELIIWYSNGYVTIKGRIPLNLATSIWDKYPNNLYQIRVNGESYSDRPKDHAVDEVYEKEILNHLDELRLNMNAKGYILKCEDSLKRLKKRTGTNKYITCYHIDTKEGFNIFLSEYSEYLVDKKEQEKEKMIKQIVKKLYKK